MHFYLLTFGLPGHDLAGQNFQYLPVLPIFLPKPSFI
nr:MAG TPA_asm: hypothetical protein [Caudoviricetes sp.]